MRKIIGCVGIFSLLLSCNLNKPLDYYNFAVGAGNGSLTFNEMERRMERLESGMNLDTINLVESVQNRIPYNEKVLSDLNKLLGNKESDPMIMAAIAFSQFNIRAAKTPKTIKILKVVGNARTFEAVGIGLDPFEEYLDSIYDVREKLWTTYDFEVTKYAKKNDIDMEYY